METKNITKGMVKPFIREYQNEPRDIVTGIGVELGPGYFKIIADMILPDSDELYIEDHEEIKANAELMSEAFNVANETGLSPMEVLKQKERLVKLLKRAKLILMENDMYEMDQRLFAQAIEACE